MKQSTADKLKAILAAQQAQANKINPANFSGKNGTEKKEEAKPAPQATTPAPVTPAPQPEVKAQPKPNREKSPLKSFSVLWHEGGTRDVEGRTATNWNNASYLLQLIGNPDYKGTYNKTGILVEWENGQIARARIDIGENKGGFNPNMETLSEYLSKHNIFGRNFDLANVLQIEDEPEALKRKDIETAPEPHKPGLISVILPEDNKPPVIVEKPANAPEIGSFTIDDILAGNMPTEEETAPPAQQPAPVVQQQMKTAAAPKPYTAPKPPATPAPGEPILPPLELVRYSAKSLVIFGTRTKELRQEIKDMGGKFNAILNYKDTGTRQPGWFFYYTPEKEEEIKEFIKFFL